MSFGQVVCFSHESKLHKFLMITNQQLGLKKNPIFNDCSKHIDTRYHRIKKCYGKRKVKFKSVKSGNQNPDIL